MIILDTNVISEFIRPRPDPSVLRWLDSLETRDVFITAMTAAELLDGVARLPPGRRRSDLAGKIARLLDVGFADRIVGFDLHAAVMYAQLRAARDAAGRPISVSDAVIAASALAAGAERFVTRNIRDFLDVGLDLHNPWDRTRDNSR